MYLRQDGIYLIKLSNCLSKIVGKEKKILNLILFENLILIHNSLN